MHTLTFRSRLEGMSEIVTDMISFEEIMGHEAYCA